MERAKGFRIMLFWRPTTEFNEERMVLRAQSGDRHALDRLLERHEVALFHHVHRILADEAATYDVLQETFIVVAKNISKLRERVKFKAWLYGCATRVALRSRKRNAVRAAQETDNEPISTSPRALEAVLQKEQIRKMTAEVDRLSPPLRAVVLLHYLEELTLCETAKALELPIGTVKSRLAAALYALRERLSDPTNTDAGRTQERG